MAIFSFTTLGGLYVWHSNRRVALFWLGVTIIFFICYVVSLYILRKKFSIVFILFNAALYFILLVKGPSLQLFGLQIKDYLETPSMTLQKQLHQEVATVIEKIKVPYKINIEKSKRLTSQRSKIVVALMKNEKEDVQKKEIDAITRENFSKDIFLSFYNYDEKWIISIKLNVLQEVEYCSPNSKCEELGIEVNE